MGKIRFREDGAALVMVLLMLLIFLAVGAFVMLAVDRNTEMRVAYQRSVAGFHAAEAAVNREAARIRNIFLSFNTPGNEDCTEKTLEINDRIVRYRLSVPENPPGDCSYPPERIRQVTLPAGNPFEGLNALTYTYNLRAEATYRGQTEAIVNMQFDAYLIPMFQFASFYGGDLELTVGPPMVVNGRMHSNGDMYLNTNNCSPGLRILGHLTIRGDLYRGRKDHNSNFGRVRISLDGSDSNLLHLGITGPGDTSCTTSDSPADRRGPIPREEIVLFGGRINDEAEAIRLPDPGLNCAPWSCPRDTRAEDRVYWNNADIRIVLDATRTAKLDPDGKVGPALYPVVVMDRNGNLDSAKTEALRRLMREKPGVITYTDVPRSRWDCRGSTDGPGCEARYRDPENYTPKFPGTEQAAQEYECGESFRLRGPRDPINGLPVGAEGSNYCYDYRYGGFFNHRERKPLLMLNIDWMALEEWNQQNGAPLWNPRDTTHGGVVVFLSVRGPNSRGANNYAVRIYDAQRLTTSERDSGVTFASDVAFYIAGNFNCADPDERIRDDAAPMPCGSGDRRDRTIGKRPSSVVGDTINVLSCAWVSQAWEGENPEPGGNGTADDPWNRTGPCRDRFQYGRAERITNWGNKECGGANVTENPFNCPYRPRDERSTTRRDGRSDRRVDDSGHPSKRTVVNAAFLAGSDPTWCPDTPSGLDCNRNQGPAGNWYGGGLENYPRFHECWDACNRNMTDAEFNGRFWYEGSLVALAAPEHTCFSHIVNGRENDPLFPCSRDTEPYPGFWRAQRYAPPQRRWFYDVSFNDARNLPPLSPRFLFLVQNFFTEESR